MSSLPERPSSFSTWISTGRPWVSPRRRRTASLSAASRLTSRTPRSSPRGPGPPSLARENLPAVLPFRTPYLTPLDAKAPPTADGAKLHRRDGSLEDPRGTTPLVRCHAAPDLSMGAITPSRCNGRTRPILITPGPPAAGPSLSVGGSGRIFGPRPVPGFAPSPARSFGVVRPSSFPSSPLCKAFVAFTGGRVKSARAADDPGPHAQP